MKKVLALLLALIMTFQISPLTVLAETAFEQPAADEKQTGTVPAAGLSASLTGHSDFAPATPSEHNHTGWTKWTNSSKLPMTAGKYYLDTDITISGNGSSNIPSGNITLCFNGHTVNVKHASGQSGDLYRLTDEKEIVICDCQKSGIINGTGTVSSAIYIAATATGSVALYDLDIKNMKSIAGCAVNLAASSSADCLIKNCDFIGGAPTAQGIIYHAGTGSLNIDSCTFTGISNSSTTAGHGGVIHFNNTATGENFISNSSFTGNKGRASIIYTTLNNKLAVKDTVITGNTLTETSGQYAGALYFIDSKSVLEGANVIKDNFNSAATPVPADIMLQNAATTFTLSNPTADTQLYIKSRNGIKAAGDTIATLSSGSMLGTYKWTFDETLSIINEEGNIKLAKAVTDFTVPSSIKIAKGERFILSAQAVPADGFLPLNWTLAEGGASVVGLTADGMTVTLEGLELGTTALTATSKLNPALSKTIDVTVAEKHGHDGWINWGDEAAELTKLPMTAGSYYLTQDIVISGDGNNNKPAGDINLCLNGHTITVRHGGGKNGDLYRISDNVNINICDCEKSGIISGHNSGTQQEPVYDNILSAFYCESTAAGSVTISDITIEHLNTTNSANGSGLLAMIAGSIEFTVKNCRILNNDTVATAILCNNGSGLLTVSGTEISGNYGVANGTVISGRSGSKTLIENCTAAGNICNNAAVFYFPTGAGVTVKDSTITQNTVNTTGDYAGALYLIGADDAIIEGTAVIRDNVNGAGQAADLMLQNAATTFILKNPTADTNLGIRCYGTNKTLGSKLGTLAEGSFLGTYTWTKNTDITIEEKNGNIRIPYNIAGIALPDIYVVAGQSTEVAAITIPAGQLLPLTWEIAASDAGIASVSAGTGMSALINGLSLGDASITVKNEEEGIFASATIHVVAEAHSHCLCGDEADAHCDHIAEEFVFWNSSSSLPIVSGNYVLTSDINLSAGAVIPTGADVKLCLNGHTVTSDDASITIYTVNGTSKLTFCDCTASGSEALYSAGKLCGVKRAFVGSLTTGSINIYDGIICNMNYTDSGCVVYLGSGTMNIFGGAVKNNTSMPGPIRVRKGASLNIFGGYFSGNEAGAAEMFTSDNVLKERVVTNGGVIAATDAFVHIENAVFEGNKASNYGSVIYMEDSEAAATLQVSNTVFRNNAAQGLKSTSTVDADTGERIYTDTVTGDAAVFIKTKKADSRFTFTNCTFTGNTAEAAGNGGAIHIDDRNEGSADNSELIIDGCTFTGNTSTSSGGSAIMIGGHDAVVTIKDTTVTGNTGTNPTTAAGAIYITDIEDQVIFKGKVVIRDNYAVNGNSERNVYAQNNNETAESANVITFKVDGLTADSYISILTRAGDYSDPNKLVASDAMPDVWGNIIMADSYGQYVKLDKTRPVGQQFYFSYDHHHCLCGTGDDSHCSHESHDWAFWEKNDILPTADGYYALTQDVVLSAPFSTPSGSDIHLCLNGHNITSAEGISCRSLIRGSYTISDCKARISSSGEYISGCFSGFSDGVLSLADNAGAKLEIYDGTFCHNTRETNGSVLYVGHTNKLSIYRAKINDNTAAGSAIRTGNDAVIDIYDGWFRHNDATTGNGGFLGAARDTKVNIHGGEYSFNNAAQGGTFLLSNGAIGHILGGTFKNNTASYAAVFMIFRDGALTIENGDFSGNTVTSAGGAGYASVGSRLYINGGSFHGNKSKTKGGAIFGDRTIEIIISGGTYYNNETASGGAIATSAVESFKMTGGTVKNNKASSNGGGLFFYSGTAKRDDGTSYRTPTYASVSGVKITGNKAQNAGAVLVDPASEATFKNCSISSNRASSAGGAMYLNKSKIKISGCSFSDNYSKKNGGAVFVAQASVTIDGGTMSGNNSEEGYGGAVYANGGTIKLKDTTYGHGYVNISGTTIKNNKAKWAGAICLGSAAKCTLSGCTIRNNTGNTAGAVLVQSEGTNFKVRNTSFKNNIGNKSGGGAVYISYKTQYSFSNCKFIDNECTENRAGALYIGGKTSGSVTGCTFTGNKSKGDGGAMSTMGAVFTMSDCSFDNNYAQGQAGGLCVSRATVDSALVYGDVTVKNCKFTNNVSEKYGGGAMVQGQSTLTTVDCYFEANGAKYGGAVGNGAGTYNASGCVMCGNSAEIGGAVRTLSDTQTSMSDCEIFGNKATVETGGGIATYAQFTGDKLNVHDNEAVMGGGGIGIRKGTVATITDSIIKDNKTPGEGGGIGCGVGGQLYLIDSVVTGNTAGTSGGGIYADYGITLIGDTVTGNKAGQVGGVHIVSARYDGMSLVRGIYKLGGNLVVKDNDGEMSGMYIGKGTVFLLDRNEFDKEASVHINLEEGKITKTLLGAFDYEGGNCVYDVTAGDKSMTEIEPDPIIDPPNKKEEETSSSGSAEAESTKAAEEGEGVSAGALIGIIASAAVVAGGAAAIGIAAARRKRKRID